MGRAKKDVPRACTLVQKFDAFVAERGFATLTYDAVEDAHVQQIMLVDPRLRTKNGCFVLWTR